MSKKRVEQKSNRIKKTVRSGAAAAGAAVLLFGNMAAFTQVDAKETKETMAAYEGMEWTVERKGPDESIGAEKAATEEIETKRYKDVEFVSLPVRMDEEDQEKVFRICKEYNVSFPLVMALIEKESQFDRLARSKTGDSGYMQINDCNAEYLSGMGFCDLYDLEENVGAGVFLLKELFEKYDGDVDFVLMAYNAGEKRAQEMMEQGIYETEYTKEILERADVFSSYIDKADEERTSVR
jgi:hypothetical protein